ncbi:DUF4239 domain-containing protein [Mycobacterium sp.]|uniref:bestrophin-like domain n=1 Tax=Mycobacterium sp. TaxID=1785 RepID=UPI003C7089F4
MIWLLQVPPLIVGTLTVIVVVALSLLGLFSFRRLVSQTRLENAHSVSGEVFFSLAGVLYAVLVAFVVVVVWEQFGHAEQATESEASAIADLLRDSHAFPAADRPQVQQALIAYLEDVRNDEFPRMRKGEAIEQQSEQLTHVWESYLKIQPVSRTEIAFYDQAIHRLDDLSTSRKERIATGAAEIPGELWVLLIGGGAIVMAFTFMFGTPDAVVHATAVALTAALMGFVMYLIFALEHPFVGTLSVKPEAYSHVVDIWQQQEEHK